MVGVVRPVAVVVGVVGAVGNFLCLVGAPSWRVGVAAPDLGVAELGLWGVEEKEFGVVGRDRGTPEPKATVGVVARGVVAPDRRRSMLAVGVRRPDETEDLGVLDL